MYDELMDELREILEERSADIEALANEIDTEDELQSFVARVDTKLQSVVNDLEREREAMSYMEES
ncbi:MAG: hypothetical protein ACYC9O_08025 [Candidatus Latescibacterota bacterium]